MPGLIYHTDKRNVLPQLERTTTYIETLKLSIPGIENGKSKYLSPFINLKDDNLDDKLIEWKESKNLNLAGDIISQAIVLNKSKDIEVVKNYLLANFPTDNILQWLYSDGANKILNENRIKHNFNKLRLEPKDSLTWTDQAINYLILNEREDSIKCIEEALKINYNNGYIVRNASRIFSLTGDKSRAIKTLKNSEDYKFDPQIVSAEIAFSQLENRKTSGIDIGYKLLNENQYKNHEKYELASTLGTIEFLKGEIKKSEKLFAMSLLEPTKNAFAQYLWYKKGSNLIDKNEEYMDSNEIKTHINFKNNYFSKSLEFALAWKSEEPYSIRPYKVASHLCGVLLSDYENAFKLLKDGLDSQRVIKADNFNFKEEIMLSNDLAYYLLKSGKTEEAEKYLKPIFEIEKKTSKLDDSDNINIATLGLFAYKQKRNDLGNKLYRKVIKYFTDNYNPYLAGSAFLNFFDEEINYVADLETLQNLKKELDNIIPKDAQNDLLFRKSNSLKLFENAIYQLKNN